MENNEKIKVESAGIDKDVLDIMTQEDVLKAISDETQMKRFELNFFCEFLSEIKGLRKDFDEFSQMISVCSAEKLADFFKELQGNVAQEQKRMELQEKMSQSHKKSKKSSQNGKKLSKGVK